MGCRRVHLYVEPSEGGKVGAGAPIWWSCSEVSWELAGAPIWWSRQWVLEVSWELAGAPIWWSREWVLLLLFFFSPRAGAPIWRSRSEARGFLAGAPIWWSRSGWRWLLAGAPIWWSRQVFFLCEQVHLYGGAAPRQMGYWQVHLYLDDRVVLQVCRQLAKYMAELASALAVHSAVAVRVLRPHG